MTSAEQTANDLHERLTGTDSRLIAEVELEGGSGGTLHLTSLGTLTGLWLAEGWFSASHWLLADPSHRDSLILLPIYYEEDLSLEQEGGDASCAHLVLFLEPLESSVLPDSVEFDGIDLPRVGTVLGVSYQAVRDGDQVDNVHPFLTAAGLYASPGPGLQVIHGQFTITDHGIEDTEG